MGIELTGQLAELKAQAEGKRAFRKNERLEALTALDLRKYRRLDPTTRLELGYYLTAKGRAEKVVQA